MPQQTTISDVKCADVSAHTLPTDETSLAALEALCDRIKLRGKTYQIETGRDLIKAKALLPHGAFGKWLADKFKWSDSTAQNFMNAARLAEEKPEVEKLAPAAVRALAAPNTPEAVKSAIVAEIKAGNVPSTKTIKAKIATAKAPKPVTAKQPASATVTALPRKTDATVAPMVSDNSDLVDRLRAAGMDAARAAFMSAFPTCSIIDDSELQDDVMDRKAA